MKSPWNKIIPLIMITIGIIIAVIGIIESSSGNLSLRNWASGVFLLVIVGSSLLLLRKPDSKV